MNPLPILLLTAMMSRGGGSPSKSGFSDSGAMQLDSVLSALQNTVSTLEKVSQLSQMTNTAGAVALPASAAAAHSAESESAPAPDNSAALSAADLQNAMQSLAPLISMFTGNQSDRK